MEKFLTDLGLTQIKAIRHLLGGKWTMVGHRNFAMPVSTTRWAREPSECEVELVGKEEYGSRTRTSIC